MNKIFTLLIIFTLFISASEVVGQESSKSRLMVGGYGEVTMSRHFYSDAWQRYSAPSLYKDAEGHGRVDIPHAVFFLGYSFGQGWSFVTEVEFEHGGTEAAVEIEEEETGEYETEVGVGGKIVLEQFWINKKWSRSANLKMGHIIIPVGFTNKYHLPTEYFGVFRPEGETSIMPGVWHETGFSFWGGVDNWNYEIMLVAGLDADRFGSAGWIKGGASSPYEFKVANSYAGAFRIDNFSVNNLRLGLSGYYGHSASNTLKSAGYADLKGAVAIGAFDFKYEAHNMIIRGNVDYGTLGDSEAITIANIQARLGSPSPKQPIGSAAISTAVEAGYDIFSQIYSLKKDNQKLYLFGRYEYYDSMYKTEGEVFKKEYWERNCISVGLNYSPLKDIVIKAEYQSRVFSKQYNNENTLSIGIMYSGLFTR